VNACLPEGRKCHGAVAPVEGLVAAEEVYEIFVVLEVACGDKGGDVGVVDAGKDPSDDRPDLGHTPNEHIALLRTQGTREQTVLQILLNIVELKYVIDVGRSLGGIETGRELDNTGRVPVGSQIGGAIKPDSPQIVISSFHTTDLSQARTLVTNHVCVSVRRIGATGRPFA
jgi:hypothetical protein